MARRFSASGAAGVAFQVNTFTTGGQYTPKVAFDGAGRFVVVWAFYDQDRGAVLAGQKYDATGTPIGGEFQVNTDTSCCVGYTGFEWPPLFDDIDIAGDAAGDFVVVWRGPSASGDVGNDIAARFFDVTGAPTSPDQLVVNEDTKLGREVSCGNPGSQRELHHRLEARSTRRRHHGPPLRRERHAARRRPR